MRLLTLSFSLLVTGSSAATAQSLAGVVPAVFRTITGNSGLVSPFGVKTHRHQQVFLGSELPATRKIVGLGLRFDSQYLPFAGYEVDCEIRLAYTKKTVTNLSSVFAQNFDIGTPAPVMVWPRAKFRLPDQTVPRTIHPSQFEVQIPFKTPFSWVRSAGRNLLIEVRVFGSNQGVGLSYALDAGWRNSLVTTSRVFHSSPTATSGSMVKNQGLVMNFLDRILDRGSSVGFGAACQGTGGRAGIIVPKLAQYGFGGSKRSIGGRTLFYQLIVDRSELGATKSFTGFQFRMDTGTFGFAGRNVTMEVEVGHTKVSSSTMSTTFKTNATGALTKVLPVTSVWLPSVYERNSDPRYFLVRIPWSKSFTWNSSLGQNLVIQMKVTDPRISAYSVDGTTRFSGIGSLVSGSHTATTGTKRTGGFVMRLTTSGPGSLMPKLRTIGRPVIGAQMEIVVRDALESRAAMLFLGASSSSWNGTSLPLPLAAIGGHRCALLVSPDVAIPSLTNSIGTGTRRFQLPNNPTLLGLDVYSQWAILDQGANVLGVSWSGGSRLHVGGF